MNSLEQARRYCCLTKRMPQIWAVRRFGLLVACLWLTVRCSAVLEFVILSNWHGKTGRVPRTGTAWTETIPKTSGHSSGDAHMSSSQPRISCHGSGNKASNSLLLSDGQNVEILLHVDTVTRYPASMCLGVREPAFPNHSLRRQGVRQMKVSSPSIFVIKLTNWSSPATKSLVCTARSWRLIMQNVVFRPIEKQSARLNSTPRL